MGFLLNVAKSLPVVLLGSLTHWLLFKDAEVVLGRLGKRCPQVATYSFRSGNEAADKLLCVLVQFFKQAQETSEGQWVTGYIGTTLLSTMAFMAVEGSRYGSGCLLSLLPIHALLFQLNGISVVLPALWLPLYFFYDGGNRSKLSAKQRKVSGGRVILIACGLFWVLFSFAGIIFPFNLRLKELFILATQFAPILVPFLWLPVRTTAKTRPVGHKAVIALHLLQAGAGLAWHVVGILFVVRDPDLPWRVLQAVTTHTTGTYAVFFLALDTIVVVLSLTYLAVLEDGICLGVLITCAAVPLGPATALSFYFVYREQLLSAVDSAKKIQ